ncbi:pseudouridine synthase [Stackebrandtia nassauensis]|uniref:Pseudouridine synthase n=1 Tax=Stackebrandtia nassauensis (strain DSM 44728 / CIP 108903 / NRRL B-16338 / NBRC 102104 / LLR-40K-21) TaxID=446470 RepID=D3Q521_STANL|nr:pseudouridine synthase [Stackebrandtia nassauensis]ADD44070.1 pseudouridine synthase [Stackebrandtia nassauensis DSM 44728]
MTAEPEGVRLQKVMAAAGIGSRRACENLIAAGRVTVNGKKAQLGNRVDPQHAVIHVDGERVITDTKLVHFALNKPRGYVSTMDDELKRPDLNEFTAGISERVFHVGRLDTESEGLLLLTNDGELGNRLTHPSYEIAKTYRCQVTGYAGPAIARRLAAGVVLEDGPVTVDDFKVIDEHADQALVEIVVHEGRKHVVRRLLAEVGLPVNRLVRTAIGDIRLANLKPGTLRKLRPDEIASLYRTVGL